MPTSIPRDIKVIAAGEEVTSLKNISPVPRAKIMDHKVLSIAHEARVDEQVLEKVIFSSRLSCNTCTVLPSFTVPSSVTLRRSCDTLIKYLSSSALLPKRLKSEEGEHDMYLCRNVCILIFSCGEGDSRSSRCLFLQIF